VFFSRQLNHGLFWKTQFKMSGDSDKEEPQTSKKDDDDEEHGSASESDKEEKKKKKKKPAKEKAKKERKPREKKKKEKDGPKKPMTAYMLFSQASREQVKKDKPSLAPKEVMKELAARWSAVSKDEKKKFEKLQEEDKIRYQKECQEKGFEPKGRGGLKKPKGAKSAYNCYAAERRAEMSAAGQKLDFSETNKTISSEWKDVKPEDKKKYEELAKEDKVRYEKDLKEFEAKGGVIKKKKKASKKGGKKKKKAAEESDDDAEAEKSDGD